MSTRDPDTMASEPGGGGAYPPAPAQRRPYGVACLGCRRVKMRCIIFDQDSICDRCARLRKDCVFETHRRGLWKRNRPRQQQQETATEDGSADHKHVVAQQAPWINSPSATAPVQATTSTSVEDATNRAFPDMTAVRSGDRRHTAFDAARTPGIGSPTPVHRPPTTSPPAVFPQSSSNLPPARARSSHSLSQSPEREERGISFNVASFVTSDVDAGELAVDVALDTQRRIMEGSNSARSMTSSDGRDKSWKDLDPIHLKLLTRPAAEVLFEGFMKNFNTLAGFLDPDLYTFPYTREASNLLFTSILAIAATIFRPELYRSLKQHQETLLGKALLTCDAAVETVFTLILLYYWKDVGDRRGYNLVGFAIQLAKSAEWNKTLRPSRDLSQAETVLPTQMEMEVHVRRRRGKHLAWLILGALDRTSSMFTNRPFTNPPLTDVSTSRSWINSEPESYTWGCTRHVAGYEMTQIARPVYDFILQTEPGSHNSPDGEPFRPSDGLLEFMRRMRKFNEDMYIWRAYWVPVFTNVAPLQQQSQVGYYGSYLKLYFNSILLHRILVENGDDVNDSSVIQALSTCYFSCMSVLQEARTFGRLDLLYYIWDPAHLINAYAAMMLLKILNLSSALPETAPSDALEVLTELLVAYTTTAQAMGWRPETQPMAIGSDKVPVANGLEAQARLLRSIVGTISARFRVKVSTAAATTKVVVSASAAPYVSSAPTPPPLSYMQAALGEDIAVYPPPGPSVHQGDDEAGGEASMTMMQLVDDMDFSLDTSYMDAKFLDAGLLGWDELGIFADDK